MNPEQVWGIFQPAPGQVAQLRSGQALQVIAEGSAARPLTARLDLVEPQYRAGASTAAVRVYLPNLRGLLRRGTRLTGRVAAGGAEPAAGWWLPRAGVVDLGTRQVAFVRRGRTFVPVPVQAGQRVGGQVLRGLSGTEDVAANGQYLVDSESFVQTSSSPSSSATNE
ncbi:secretion protein HlyD [Hymenobacter roseosalivarius DSM 11622]|uniref:Secretion protein HlyD n=1 Tax=Hymenobacter roseosalivarius DSM 11622 TaxID=645990 RepID=A0A1W1UQV6_9BACT|nr:hypothetical protein [Hymenobacter roseosalivarius]SMB83505.1 secretion protein HlyD [Hymenobacter roseosalivarius DSM 11622]